MSNAAIKKQDKLFTGIFLLDMIMYLGSTVDTYIFSSSFTTIATSMGGSLVLAGTLSGTYSLAAIIMRPFAGKIIDRFGKRRTIFFGTLLVALMIVGYMFSPSIYTLFVFRVLHGLAFSCVTAGCYGSAADLVPESRKTFGLGWFSNMATLSSYIGPVIGTWGIGMYDRTGSWNYLYLSGLATCVWVAVLVSFVRYEDKEEYKVKLAAQKAAEKAQNEKLSTMTEAELAALGPVRPKAPTFLNMPVYGWMCVLTLFLVSGAHCSVGNFLLLAAREQGMAGIGNYFLMQTIGLFIGRGVITHLVDRFGPFKVLAPVLLIGAGCFCVMANATSVTTFLLVGIPYGFMYGSTAPTVNSLIVQSCGPTRTGFGAAMYLLSIDLGYGVFPTLWGATIGSVGYANVYYFAAVCPVLAILVIAIYWFKWGKTLHENRLTWAANQALAGA